MILILFFGVIHEYPKAHIHIHTHTHKHTHTHTHTHTQIYIGLNKMSHVSFRVCHIYIYKTFLFFEIPRTNSSNKDFRLGQYKFPK